ncbi:MAG TPA: hypothetical protein VJ160_02445 [Anaerolineales bacterium]|nr:hypothetical protein [Anaerolineales bacterium]
MGRAAILRHAGVASLWVLAACAPPASSTIRSRAGLVVGHGDGSFATTCVIFEGSEISGEELLRDSGIPVSLDAANPMGSLVCAIGDEGCDFPRQDCLCACRGSGGCSYWAYFNWAREGVWNYGSLGAGQRRVRDGDMDAWIWLDRAHPSDDLPTPPVEISFETVCG